MLHKMTIMCKYLDKNKEKTQVEVKSPSFGLNCLVGLTMKHQTMRINLLLLTRKGQDMQT